MRSIRFMFTSVIIIFLCSIPAYGHKVNVFAWVEDETVHTQSKFSGSKKVKDGKIEVFDHRNQKVLDGVTDNQGYFAFPLPKEAQALKVVLTAGMGHSNHWQITAQELGHERSDAPAQTAGQASMPSEQVLMDRTALERIVERAVEKKLAPLKAQLAEQAWGLRDIVAGIGYILGLMGLASYVQYRKTIRSKN